MPPCRRAQRVVVRTPDAARRSRGYSPLPPEVHTNRRRRIPTLSGLGEDDAQPEIVPKQIVPVGIVEADTPPPRPAVLREGRDDGLAAAYRMEAERILASGVFGNPGGGEPNLESNGSSWRRATYNSA
jgi:hypothetical protein